MRLSRPAESAIEAISLALHSVSHALKKVTYEVGEEEIWETIKNGNKTELIETIVTGIRIKSD